MKTAVCDGGLLRICPSGDRSWRIWMFLFLSCVTASPAFVAVEFGGQISFSDLGHRRGASVSGYFTYKSGEPSGPQTDSRPGFVFEIPEDQFRLERTSYSFGVYNNSLPSGRAGDGLFLEFSYPSGYGALMLLSSNLSLFPNNLTPPTIPALQHFDAGRTLIVTVDQMQPYRTMAVGIDRLSVVPGSGLDRPVIFGVERTAGALSFRFLTESSTRYAVQVADSLPATNWQTLTNIGPIMQPIVTMHNASDLAQRFYRIQKIRTH